MKEVHPETCESCGKRFYCFSLPGEQGHMTLSIPAIDEANAMNILDDIVKKPEEWLREKKIEQSIDATTTGERKKEAPREWQPPMYS
jgi:hypothetical protein